MGQSRRHNDLLRVLVAGLVTTMLAGCTPDPTSTPPPTLEPLQYQFAGNPYSTTFGWRVCDFIGTAGNDTIVVPNTTDRTDRTICGFGGDDLIVDLGGCNDVINAGSGNDHIVVNEGTPRAPLDGCSVVVQGGPGDNLVETHAGHLRVRVTNEPLGGPTSRLAQGIASGSLSDPNSKLFLYPAADIGNTQVSSTDSCNLDYRLGPNEDTVGIDNRLASCDGRYETINVHGGAGDDIVRYLAPPLVREGVNLYGDEGDDALVNVGGAPGFFLTDLYGGPGNDLFYALDGVEASVFADDFTASVNFAYGPCALGVPLSAAPPTGSTLDISCGNDFGAVSMTISSTGTPSLTVGGNFLSGLITGSLGNLASLIGQRPSDRDICFCDPQIYIPNTPVQVWGDLVHGFG